MSTEKAVEDFLSGKEFKRGRVNGGYHYRDVSEDNNYLLHENSIAWREEDKTYLRLTTPWTTQTTRRRFEEFVKQGFTHDSEYCTFWLDKGVYTFRDMPCFSDKCLDYKGRKDLEDNYIEAANKVILKMRELQFSIIPNDEKGSDYFSNFYSISAFKLKGDWDVLIQYFNTLYTPHYNKKNNELTFSDKDFIWPIMHLRIGSRLKWNLRIYQNRLRKEDELTAQLLKQVSLIAA